MPTVTREIWTDPKSRRLWGVEVFNREIIGCLGPFQDASAFPRSLGEIAFERNAELLRWLRHRGLERTTSTIDRG
jgi:hypothetical protein